MSTEDKSKPVEDPTKDYERKYKEMSNLFKDLEKKGLTVKECGFESSRKEFIKGKDFDDILKKNLDSVCEGINKIMDTSISPTSKDAIQNIYSAFYNAFGRFCSRAWIDLSAYSLFFVQRPASVSRNLRLHYPDNHSVFFWRLKPFSSGKSSPCPRKSWSSPAVF